MTAFSSDGQQHEDAVATNSAISSFYENYVSRPGIYTEEYRLNWLISHFPAAADSLLDVGCGMGRNLELFKRRYPTARLCGIDVAENAAAHVRSLGFDGLSCDASVGIPLADGDFDIVVAGEVIEHVSDTDRMLEELHRVLKPGGHLFLTTPNLAYAVNRVLLPLGIQPIFTETSLRKNLGRRLQILGQGNATQGHLKIFTRRALEELLEMSRFEVVAFEGYNMFSSGPIGFLDKILRRVPSLAAGFVVHARAS